MRRGFLRPVATALLVTCAGVAVLGQRGGWGGIGYRAVPYDGKFVFVRMMYAEMGGRRGGALWAHDYPDGERHFMRILTSVSNVPAHVEDTSVLTFDNPELFKFPLAYLVEPGVWTLTDEQVIALRSYLSKGGFMVVDDFPFWAWQNFEIQMTRVFPTAKWVELDVTHPIFNSFFEITTLDILPAYPALGPRPIFMALFEENDPSKRMLVIANYQNDLSEFWEHSATGRYPIDPSNEAYKIGVNQFIYGITH